MKYCVFRAVICAIAVAALVSGCAVIGAPAVSGRGSGERDAFPSLTENERHESSSGNAGEEAIAQTPKEVTTAEAEIAAKPDSSATPVAVPVPEPSEPEPVDYEALLGAVDPLTPYSSARLNRDAETLAEYYPQILALSSIGQTVLGNDIPLLKLGRGNRAVLWVGAIHAREAVTGAYLLLVAEEYANAYCSGAGYGDFSASRVQQLLEEFTVYIVPIANPDGVDIVTSGGASNVRVDNAVMWRNNAAGVDLNRNFPYDWESASADATTENHLFYRGRSAGSEPEASALIDLCNSVAFEHMVSCHTAGQVVFWQDNRNGTIPGDAALAQTISNAMGYPMQPPTTFALNGWAGGFENWFRNEYQRPGICLEFARINTALPEDTARFYSDDMVSWQTSRNLILTVLESMSRS